MCIRDRHLETNSRIAEVGESYQSFNVMTKELRATEVLQMDFVSDVSHEFKTPINAIEGYKMCIRDRTGRTGASGRVQDTSRM